MSPPRLPHSAVVGLALLLLARLAVGAAYAWSVPIWEAYDEDGHFAYVRYLAKYRRLLDPADPEARAVYEKFQPPLYYLLVAPFVAGYDLGETLPRIERNPFWNQDYTGNNYALHPPRLEGTDAQVALAVRVGRLVGVVLSSLSVVFVFLVARALWPAQPGPAWSATLLYAFWPQWLFIGSVINNDLAVTACGAGVVWASVQLAVKGFQGRRALALALWLGAAMLSKVSALALLPVAALALAFSLNAGLHPTRSRPARPWLALLTVMGVVGLILSLLWLMPYVRGHVLRLGVLTDFIENAVRNENSLNVVLEAIPFTFHGFFALFGWGRRNLPSVELPSWLYLTWSAGFGLGVLGLGIGAIRRWRAQVPGPDTRLLWLLGLLVLSLLAAALALVVAYQSSDLAPGRYLLPALSGVCLLLVEGYRNLLPRRAQRYAWRALGLGAVLLGWAIPLMTLIPTYAIPQPLRGSPDVPAVYSFGDSIQLIGYQRPANFQPGQAVELSLCWQALTPIAGNYTAVLEVIGPDGERYGRLVTYPGRGNFPTHFWTAGVPFCDRYELLLDPAMPAPAQAWLHASLVDTTFIDGPNLQGTRLAVIEPGGQRSGLDAFVLPLRIEAAARPAPPAERVDYRFGDALRLRGYTRAVDVHTDSVLITLQWQALTDLDRDYRIFVHLRDTPVSAYAQSDGAPRGGWYPTSLWRAGEVIEDTHTLTLPPGNPPRLTLYAGVVDTGSELRLPAVDAAGQRLLNDEVRLLDDWELPLAGAGPDARVSPQAAAP